jgi:hypothetical protein
MKVSDTVKYKKAKKRVADIKGFYIHFSIYLMINFVLFLFATDVFNGLEKIHFPHWGYFTTPFFWGIGVFFHGLHVFGKNISFLKKWEERKVKEYMEKEESDRERFSGRKYE